VQNNNEKIEFNIDKVNLEAGLINLKADTKPLKKAIDKLVDTVYKGWSELNGPRKIKKYAKAISFAAQKLGLDDEDAKALFHRSISLDIPRLMEQQRNIESIAQGAVLALTENVSDEPVDKDWASYFFDQCRTVSNKDMQTLWSKILAGEITRPRTYSLRILNFIRTLSKEEAELFTKYCSYVFCDSDGDYYRISFDEGNKYLESKGLTFREFNKLDELGLNRHLLAVFPGKWKDSPGIQGNYIDHSFTYFGKSLHITGINNRGGMKIFTAEFSVEHLTSNGKTLYSICGAQPDHIYYNLLKESIKVMEFTVDESEC